MPAKPREVPLRKAPMPTTAEPPEAAARVLRRFRTVFNAVKTHFQQVQRSAGIGGAQLWALSVIEAQPDIGVGGLAKAMDIHQSTASNLLKALLKLDLVSTHRDGADRLENGPYIAAGAAAIGCLHLAHHQRQHRAGGLEGARA